MDNARLSPCGEQVAWTEAGDDGQVWVASFDDGMPRVAVRRRHPIRFHLWAPDGGGIIHVADDPGTGIWQLLHTAVDLHDRRRAPGATRAITDEGHHADLLAMSPSCPDTLLLAVDDPELGLPHAEQFDLRTWQSRRAATNPGTVDGWFADPALTVRAATAATADGGFDLLHRADVTAPWSTVAHVGPEAALTTVITSLPDPCGIVLVGALGSDTTQLLRLDTGAGTRQVLGSAPDTDVERVLLHPRTGQPQAFSVTAARRRWVVLDQEVADLTVGAPHGADVRVVDRSTDDRYWLLAEESPDAPTRFVRRDRRTGERREVAPRRPLAPHPRRARTEPITCRARDGLELHGYWRAPAGAAGPAPTVLLVHGGPWWRDSWVHDPWRDWIDELGFACLQVNFRGSTGRGTAFAAAGTRHWGDRVIDDLDDVLSDAVARGWSDPRRLVAFGSSFGGYAALMLAARGSVAAAAAHAAPTDLVRFLDDIPRDHPTMRLLWTDRFGDPDDPTDAAALRAVSPLWLADRIRCPVLLAHGANDTQVRRWHSDQLAHRLRTLGRDVTHLVLADEGHELRHATSSTRLGVALARLVTALR